MAIPPGQHPIAQEIRHGRPCSQQRCISLLELLLAGTLLILVLLGMNAALLSSSMVAQRSKDITAATSLA